MIAVACFERPDYLYVTLRSIEKYDSYWWSSIVVFDSNSTDPEIEKVAKSFGVQLVKLPPAPQNAKMSLKAHKYRYKIQEWFLRNRDEELMIHLDADVFVGPGALSCLADARECCQYEVLSAMNFEYFTQWLTGGQKCKEYMIFDQALITEQCWIATRDFLAMKPTGWTAPNFAPQPHSKGFVEGLPVQHLGAFCPIVTHKPPEKMLMFLDGKIVQPAPFYIDYEHFDIKKVREKLT